MTQIIQLLEELLQSVHELMANLSTPNQQLLNNKQVMELLGIKPKLLKRYRDDGLLAFSQVGDKFWYKREDIEKFINSGRCEALTQ